MNNKFVNEYEIIKQQVEEIHRLTANTCELCEGSYLENLDGATSYFILDNNRFRITIEKV